MNAGTCHVSKASSLRRFKGICQNGIGEALLDEKSCGAMLKEDFFVEHLPVSNGQIHLGY